MGFVPQVVDINGDGYPDIISGSYWGDLIKDENGKLTRYQDADGNVQSEIFVFYARPDGSFAPRLQMALSHMHSVACPVDWDGDGDFDLVTATRSRHGVQLMINSGSKTEPKFEAPTPLIPALSEEVARALMVTSAEAADWDGDGLVDIVAGTEWGQIVWFRNIGNSEEAEFGGEPEFLVGKTTVGMAYEDKINFLESHPWGSRLALHVTDWDGDGVLDVLAGDSRHDDLTKEKLSAEDYAVYQAADARAKEYRSKRIALYPKDKRREDYTEEDKLAIREGMNKLKEEYGEDIKKANELRKVETHGYVWVFRGVKK